jgi:23S rRNA (uracil1939-C5)-methyltransferase
MSKKKPLPILEDIEITDIAAEGNAIARVNNKVLFVPGVIPGDIVDVQLTRKRTSYMEGFMVKIKKPSSMRITPFCEHFGICGGCKWQQLPYPEQLKWKQKQVVDNLQRIAKVEIEKINDILPSENTQFYRNKLEYTFSDNRWLEKDQIKGETYIREPGAGFHIPGKFDKVLDINYCYHQIDPSNQIRLSLKNFILQNNLEFFNLRTKQGFIRNLIIRNSNIGEWMVIVCFGRDDDKDINKVLDFLVTEFPFLHSLMYVINTKQNDTINDLEIKLYKGRDHIIESMQDLRFKVSPKSFYQTNSKQAYKLYCIVKSMAGLSGKELVYDLYTGTGTIANFVAVNAKKVIGIDYINDAIIDARENSLINSISNTEFHTGDIKDVLTQKFIDENANPDIVITDPPRSGMHTSVLNAILYAAPAKIIYVSCNPATQARDIICLHDKYHLKEIQPVDMFPHTHHVENVALLIKREI